MATSMKRLAAVLALTLISFSALADERSPSPADRFAKLVRIIKRVFVPTPQGDFSWPHP